MSGSGREHDILAICAEVLVTNEFAPEANFFDLGGTSLQAVQILARILDKTGVEPSLVTLYLSPTFLDFANDVVSMLDGEAPRLRESYDAATPATARASILQEVMFDKVEEDAASQQLLSAAFAIDGPLDVGRLGVAMARVAGTSQSLRTGFLRVEEEVRRVVEAHVRIPIEVSDASVSDVDDVTWIQGQLIPFDRATAPLVRVAVRRHSPHRHVVLFVLDRMITDGWSMQLLLQRFALAYEHSAEQNLPLPVESVPFSEWADWQRERMSGEHLGNLVAQWRRILGDDPTALGTPLPGYHPAAHPTGAGHLTFELDEASSAGVRTLSRELGVTLYATVLAALARVVCAEIGRPWVLLQTSTANRRRTAHEQTIGPLFHHLHLMLDLSDTHSLADSARRVHEVVVQATEIGEVPHTLLQDQIWPGARLRRHVQPIISCTLNPTFVEDLSLPDLQVSPIQFDWLAVPSGTETWLVDDGSRLLGAFRWERGRLDDELCARIVRRFCEELRSVMADPDPQPLVE